MIYRQTGNRLVSYESLVRAVIVISGCQDSGWCRFGHNEVNSLLPFMFVQLSTDPPAVEEMMKHAAGV